MPEPYASLAFGLWVGWLVGLPCGLFGTRYDGQALRLYIWRGKWWVLEGYNK